MHILSKKNTILCQKAEKNSKRSAPENPGKNSLFLRILKNDKIEYKFALFDVFCVSKYIQLIALFHTFLKADISGKTHV